MKRPLKIRVHINSEVNGNQDLTDKHDSEPGGCLTDTQWAEICELGRFCCKYCGDPPLIEDVDIFLEEGICGHCKVVEEKFARD